MPTADPPRVSVVVRSHRRIPYLLELLSVLLRQRHDSFEVVVVEQTPDACPGEAKALSVLEADPRLRILDYPPLGGPRATNVGVRAARGAIVVLIDDDDLPDSDTWLREMEAHFADTRIVGVTCRHVRRYGESAPYVWRALARRCVLRYSALMTPLTFARFDEDRTPVDWLHGTNSAVRRDVALAVGLWDEDVLNQQEHSFAFKLANWLRETGQTDRYLVFRACPVAIRRTDVRGGMDKRNATLEREIASQARFQHVVIGRYHPALYRRLRPIYRVLAFARVLSWVWAGTRAVSFAQRLRETVRLVSRFHAEDGSHRR